MTTWHDRAVPRDNDMRAAVLLATTALVSIACPGRSPPVVDHADAGVADAGVVYKSCTVEDDCAYLGPGHMCMNSGCMLMDIDAPAVIVPAASEADTSIAALVDVDPDPAVFEATLVAGEEELAIVPGTTTSTWLYRD